MRQQLFKRSSGGDGGYGKHILAVGGESSTGRRHHLEFSVIWEQWMPGSKKSEDLQIQIQIQNI